MLYLEYESLLKRYYDVRLAWDALMEEKEMLFSKTLPTSVQMDKEKVSGGSPSNSFDEYLIRKEQLHLDEQILEAESIINSRFEMLKAKEKELRASKNLHDRIYVMRYIDHSRAVNIARKIGYSESQIYRILEVIEGNIEKMRENARKTVL